MATKTTYTPRMLQGEGKGENTLLPTAEEPNTSSGAEDDGGLLSPGWGRRGRKALSAAVVAFGLLSLLLVWPTAGGFLRSKSGVVLQAQTAELCAWSLNNNAWAPLNADVNIDDDDTAATVTDKTACVQICLNDPACKCAVYYDNSPLPAAWPHGNKKCWRRGNCIASQLHPDPGYSTCILGNTATFPLTGTFNVPGVDFTALTANPTLHAQFIAQVQTRLANALGVPAASIQITLTQGRRLSASAPRRLTGVNVAYVAQVPASQSSTGQGLISSVIGALPSELASTFAASASADASNGAEAADASADASNGAEAADASADESGASAAQD